MIFRTSKLEPKKKKMVLETERYFSKLFVVGGDDHKGDDDYDDNAYERKKIQPMLTFD